MKYETYDNANYLGNSSNKYVALITANSLNIKDCVINDQTTVVAKDAFSNCKFLKTVTVGEKVNVIGSDCFVNTPALEYNVYENVSYLGTKDSDYAIVMFANVPAATGIELHEDIKMITSDAFSDCINLTDIDCSKLTKAEWNDVYKINGWDNDLTIKVICSDGNIE